MDGQNYLNQIAQQTRPEKKKGGLFGSPLVKVIIGLVAVTLALLIVGVALGGDGGPKEKSVSLKLRIDDTLEIIDEYQDVVKSSALRSSSASLTSVLSNTSRDLGNYLTEKYEIKDAAKEFPKLAENAKLQQDAMDSDLFNAKISGTLDRMYAHKMAFEISEIMAEESAIYNDAKDDTLKSLLSTSYSSLENLYASFDDFSESK